MAFVLGPKSLNELQGVHPKLAAVVNRAIHYSKVDFGVHDGLRTKAEQAEYVRTGTSRTMNSKHMAQADGFSHAVDLVPFINGKLRWEWPPIFQIATAVHRATVEERVNLIWGGVWDRKFPVHFKGSATDMKNMVDAYVDRRKAQGKSALIDGPHFELVL